MVFSLCVFQEDDEEDEGIPKKKLKLAANIAKNNAGPKAMQPAPAAAAANKNKQKK